MNETGDRAALADAMAAGLPGWLVVERGIPYEQGARISLDALEHGDMIIGRISGAVLPDVRLSSPFISRSHCRLHGGNDRVWLTDLGSRHGTAVNGMLLPAHEERELGNGDRINLAQGTVVLRYLCGEELDLTIDIQTPLLAEKTLAAAPPIDVDRLRRHCQVDGKTVRVTGKEWSLLLLLYDNMGKMVPYEEIKKAVWPERRIAETTVVDVGIEEMNTLVYRLRRKLGKGGRHIRTLRGCGCLLEFKP